MRFGNCWFYAVPLVIQYGGRLIVRRSRLNWMIPHVMYSPPPAKRPEEMERGSYMAGNYLVVGWRCWYWSESIAGVEVEETKPVAWVRRAFKNSRLLRWFPILSIVFPYTVRHGVGEAFEDD